MKKEVKTKRQEARKLKFSNKKANKQKSQKTRAYQKAGFQHFISDFKDLPRWIQKLFIVEIIILQLILILALTLLII